MSTELLILIQIFYVRHGFYMFIVSLEEIEVMPTCSQTAWVEVSHNTSIVVTYVYNISMV